MIGQTFTQAELNAFLQKRLTKDRRERGHVGELQNERDYLHAERDALVAERGELRRDVARLTADNDALRVELNEATRVANTLITLWKQHERCLHSQLGIRARKLWKALGGHIHG